MASAPASVAPSTHERWQGVGGRKNTPLRSAHSAHGKENDLKMDVVPHERNQGKQLTHRHHHELRCCNMLDESHDGAYKRRAKETTKTVFSDKKSNRRKKKRVSTYPCYQEQSNSQTCQKREDELDVSSPTYTILVCPIFYAPHQQQLLHVPRKFLLRTCHPRPA